MLERKPTRVPIQDKINIYFTFRYPSQFREIAIDPQIKTSDGQIYDIMFVGTDKGQVLKIVNSANKILGEKNRRK